MPLFDYQCTSCNHIFSELRRGSEKDLSIACPECNTENAKRRITGFAVGSSSTSSPANECASAATCPAASSGFG
ncbi:MAG: zinc ribbon domain-containing protein [Proteobacteria bacterium]|nr:zinc ribbon domain-containing protein [Pseudomonadota bacterium]